MFITAITHPLFVDESSPVPPGFTILRLTDGRIVVTDGERYANRASAEEALKDIKEWTAGSSITEFLVVELEA